MERSRARRLGVKAVICALGLVSPVRASDDRVPEAARLELPASAGFAGAVVYRARSSGARPLTVLLHGMCGDAARTCSYFAAQVTEGANLVCPRASLRCASG